MIGSVLLSHAESVHKSCHGWRSASGVQNFQNHGKQSRGTKLAVEI